MKKKKSINEEFLDEHYMKINACPWFTYMENHKATKSVPKNCTWQQKKHLYKQANHYLWDDPYLFKVSTI